MGKVKMPIITSYEVNGDPDGRANSDAFEFSFGGMRPDDHGTEDEMALICNLLDDGHAAGGDVEDRWIDILTMSPPVNRAEEDDTGCLTGADSFALF